MKEKLLAACWGESGEQQGSQGKPRRQLGLSVPQGGRDSRLGIGTGAGGRLGSLRTGWDLKQEVTGK